MASLKFIFMDAGQGDCTLVVYPDDSLMLIDCGSTKNKAVVLPEIVKVLGKYLPKAKYTVRTLVLTHPDADHHNLLNDVNNQFSTPITYTNIIFGGKRTQYNNQVSAFLTRNQAQFVTDFCEKDGSYNIPNKPCSAISRAALGVEGWVLSANPTVKDLNSRTPDRNDTSVVILMKYQDIKVYLMGDAGEDVEDCILRRYKSSTLLDPPRDGRVVLKAGHHGSSGSSSDPWIKKIKPQMFFFSADFKYNMPKTTKIAEMRKQTKLHTQPRSHTGVLYNNDPTATTHGWRQYGFRESIYTTMYKLSPETGGSYYYTINDDRSTSVKRTD